MANLLGFLRRKGPSEADAARSSRAAPLPTPPPAPPPAPASSSRADKEDAELVADLAPARRQASQLNLNRYFASAPAGLNAVLKQPSRPDLEASKSGGSGSLQSGVASNGPSHQAHPPSQGQVQASPDAPLARPMRERRRSMTVSEIAASMQNIDVSQAALIMMPNRMRQELGQNSFTQTQQQQAAMQLQMLQQAMAGGGPAAVLSPGQLPQLGRSNGPPAVSEHTSAPVPSVGALGSGAVLTRPPLERKPSIIREAVKLTQGTGPESQLRSHAGNFSGELQQAPLSQIASAVAGQGLDRTSGGNASRAPGDRRSSMLITSQQLGGLAGGGGGSGPGSNRSLLPASGSGGLSPTGVLGLGQPQPLGAPAGVARRSDQGEHQAGFRGRTVGGMPAEVVMVSRGGMGMGGMGRAAGGGGAEEPLRRGVMANRNGDQQYQASYSAGQQMQQQDDQEYQQNGPSSDVKLPSIAPGSGPAGPRRANGDTRDKDGGGRGGLSAADVAALSEAIASYQNEATRLRAAALRKVDTRIKRAVMDRHLGGGGGAEDDTSPGGLVDSNNPLSPLMRSPVAGANSRNSLAQTGQVHAQASPNGRSRAPDTHRAPSGVSGPGSGELLGRGRQRL